MRAFALMRQPVELEAAFVESPHYCRGQGFIDQLRALLPTDLAARYRGIGRFPFTEYPERGPGWQGNVEYDDGEAKARALLTAFLGPYDMVTPYPRAFLTQVQQAASVQTALARPDAYEIVELCTHPEAPIGLLGFDVGYWGGGNFSILCDAAVWPTWHPPEAEAVTELARRVGGLNRNGLFPTTEEATIFTAWYSSQEWAEKQSTDFAVIAVGAHAG